MKNIFLIISILSVLIISCSSTSSSEKNNNHDIQKAKKEALKDIDNSRKNAIEEINSIAYETEKKLNNINTIIKDLNDKIQKISDRITPAYILSIIGLVIGLIGLIIALFAYKGIGTNTDQVKETINEEVGNNPILQNIIRNIVHKTPNNGQQSSRSTSFIEQQVKSEVEKYVNTTEFKVQLENILKTSLTSTDTNQPYIQTIFSPTNQVVTKKQIATKSSYELYAKDSTTMQLSGIQSSFQRGKSVYKLILENSDSNIAQLSLCIEQEDTKRRILTYGNQYLEPICIVHLLSNKPTNVEVKTPGTAERDGEEWKVTKQITVEIK